VTDVAPERPRERARILVIEQDRHTQQQHRTALADAGCVVEFAEDGLEGLQRARSGMPEMLITEILVPRMDGLSVCRVIKSNPETQSIQVVVFSILAAQDRAREAGADAFLQKPLEVRELIEVMRRLLARSAGRGAGRAASHQWR
jgi:CheY-like chemotaxis protein